MVHTSAAKPTSTSLTKFCNNITVSAPLTFLSPAIELIGRNTNVLPATGGAFEDMARSDVEEADDRFFGSKTDAKEGFQDFAEIADYRMET
jgi:hypothetical protein